VQHWLAPQVWPQVPQSVALELTSTQADPHIVPLQAQTPWTQDSAAPHSCPQAPQA